MHFNPETRNYEAALLFKQGFYDYATQDKQSGALDYTGIDGSHW